MKHTNELQSNEQTFLAWLRTGVEIMAFGFVAVKFSLFASQIAGIALVGLGALMIILSYIRFRRTVNQLKRGEYRYSTFLLSIAATAIVVISLVLLLFLIQAYLNPVDSKSSDQIKRQISEMSS